MPYALSDFLQFTGCIARVWRASHSFLATVISDPEYELPFQTAEMFVYSSWSSLGYLGGYIAPLDREAFFVVQPSTLIFASTKFWLITVKALLNMQCTSRGRFSLLSLHFLNIEEMLTKTSQLQVQYLSSPRLRLRGYIHGLDKAQWQALQTGSLLSQLGGAEALLALLSCKGEGREETYM